MPKKIALANIVLAAFVLLGAPARAAVIDSGYTDINLDDCTIMNADDFGASWACPGYRGYPVYVAEGDLRFMVSYGFKAPDEFAATQTPPPFNHPGTKLEWRLSNASGDFRPIATILRFFVDDQESEKDKQVLVITQLVPGNSCHIGYVDASSISNANIAARAIADTAGNFDCRQDQPEFSSPFTAW
ncbi:hypothetical protein PSQ90_08635 [Devosia rhodophyticola]|uniref:Uncharacterized protein n=1 Tax=Devosia rhodophyticola TaxID=3026423 RepID=A0ABY7YSV3_9HYPH|nr:hypothetical protein [Devosia rhodophyticola]WDR04418.1 hypothetical protein PSQ90_08635 [Devosia rhodophyticola]